MRGDTVSNEIVLIPTNGQLPAYLQQTGLGYQDSGLSAGVTPRAPKLGITTAKQWTVTKDGATMILPQTEVHGVLIASAMNITKAWYEKPFVPGSTEAPDCYSDDGRSPAAGVKKPQCSNCAQCPKNAFGSHPVTGRGKACADRKRVIFVWEHLPNELMTFNVPTMSLQALMKLDTELRNANIPLQAVMVKLSFDPSVIYPVVKISAIGYVPQETAFNLIKKASSQEVADLLRETEYDEPDAPPATGSPVPDQTVAMGQANAPESFPPADTGAAQTYGTVTPPPEKAKRTRRTKAQIEADNLAAMQAQAAAQAQQQATATPPAAALQGEVIPAAQQQESATVDPVAAMQAQMAELQRQLAAATAAQQQTAPDLTMAHSQATLQQAAANPPASGMDVQALLNKWQTG